MCNKDNILAYVLVLVTTKTAVLAAYWYIRRSARVSAGMHVSPCVPPTSCNTTAAAAATNSSLKQEQQQ